MVAGSAPIATATSIRLRPCVLHAAIMFRALFVRLPVHAGGALVENLHAVHAAIALAGIGIARKHQRQRDEAAAVLRPALQHGIVEQREAFACAPLPGIGPWIRSSGKNAPISASFGSILSLPMHAFGHAHFQKLDDARGDLLHRLHLERDLHLAHRGEGVDQHRSRVALRLFEQQRGSALFYGAVGELGDLEHRVHFERECASVRPFFSSARMNSRRSR